MDRNSIHRYIHNTLLILLPSSLLLPRKISAIINILIALNWLLEGGFGHKWNKLMFNRFWLLMMALFSIYAFGIVYSANYQYGFRFMEKMITLVIYATVILSSPHEISTKLFNSIFFVFVISCLVVAGICITNGLIKNYEVRDVINVHTYWLLSHHKLTAVVKLHAVYYSMYVTLGMFFLLYFLAENFRALHFMKIVVIAVAIMALAGVNILLGARMVLIAMVLVLTFGSLLFFIFKGKLKAGVITFVVVFLVSFLAISQNNSTKARFLDLFKFGKDISETQFGGYQLRMIKWKSAMEVIGNNWFLGVGTGDQMDELDKIYVKNNFEDGYKYHYNAHNQYLQTTMALGIVGLFILLVNFIYPFVKAFNHKQYLYLSFIVLFAMACFTESTLNVYRGVIFLAFFNALFAKVLIGKVLNSKITSDYSAK